MMAEAVKINYHYLSLYLLLFIINYHLSSGDYLLQIN